MLGYQNRMKSKDPTGFTRGEIAAAILGVLIPIVLFAVVLTPGAVEVLVRLVLSPGVLPGLSIAGAIIAAGVLAYRIWARTRRRKKKPKKDDPDRPPSFWDAWRNPYR